jgi:hypothetical protein
LLEAGYQFAHLFSILTGDRPPAFPHQGPRAPQRGKPSGSVKNWIFQDFVFDLDMHATIAGGKLTLEKNIRSGTLIEAIKRLARHLPDGNVLKRLSPATLQRIKDLVKSNLKAAKDLD